MPAPAAREVTGRQRQIADVAARLFRANGYRETTIRDIGAALGIKSASLYYHFGSKDEILFAISYGLMEDFVANVTPLLETAPDPTAAVSTIVDAHLRFDASHRDQVLVSAHERRSLPAQQQRPINALRARHRDALVDTIEQGRAAGAFTVDDAQIAANGVLDLLSGVKEWYEPREHGKLDALVVRYQRLVLALLRHGGGPPDAVSAGAA